MTKSMLFFIAVLIVALGARPVLAGDGREYVGETSSSTAANIGIVSMHALCDLDFPGGRMCSSSDIIRNGGVGAALPVGAAWVHPTLVVGTAVDFFLDASGVSSSRPGGLSCLSWGSISSNTNGLVLSRLGRLGSEITCDKNLPVACCAERKDKK